MESITDKFRVTRETRVIDQEKGRRARLDTHGVAEMLDEGRRGKKPILERFISIANIGPSDMPKILDIARTTSRGHAFHASYAGYGSARIIFYFITHI